MKTVCLVHSPLPVGEIKSIWPEITMKKKTGSCSALIDQIQTLKLKSLYGQYTRAQCNGPYSSVRKEKLYIKKNYLGIEKTSITKFSPMVVVRRCRYILIDQQGLQQECFSFFLLFRIIMTRM